VANSSVSTRPFTPIDEPGLDNDPMTQLTRIFVYFLQNLFREFPEGYGMKWSPNEETSEVIITNEKPRLAAIEKLPHITCVLGSMQWANTSLDQFQGSRMSDGRRSHTDLVPSTMAYHCQAKHGLVARRIAWNASKYTNVFVRLIQRGGGLHHIARNHTIGPETAPTAFTGPTTETELVSVVVTVPFYWQDGWRITGPANLFRGFRVELDVKKGLPLYSAGRSSHINPPRVGGVPVTSVPLERETAFKQVVLESNYEEEE
jgi:hypothetical protein